MSETVGNVDGAGALDIVVGCISGLRFDGIAPWVGSLDTCGFRGRRVVIHYRVDPKTVAELQRRGYHTCDAAMLHDGRNPGLKPDASHDEISVNRFYYVWYFLSQAPFASNTRFVIATDARDVVFQSDPSAWIEKNIGEKELLVGCESLRYEHEPWGAWAMQESYGENVWSAYRQREIYNAGTIAGRYQTMIDLALQVYFLAPGERVQYSDQQALNLLLASKLYRGITHFAPHEAGWACQAGTTADPKLLAQARPHVIGPVPTFDGEFVRTASGQIFSLVHQYDRVPEWSDTLKKKYSVAWRG